MSIRSDKKIRCQNLSLLHKMFQQGAAQTHCFCAGAPSGSYAPSKNAPCHNEHQWSQAMGLRWCSQTCEERVISGKVKALFCGPWKNKHHNRKICPTRLRNTKGQVLQPGSRIPREKILAPSRKRCRQNYLCITKGPSGLLLGIWNNNESNSNGFAGSKCSHAIPSLPWIPWLQISRKVVGHHVVGQRFRFERGHCTPAWCAKGLATVFL